MTTFCAMKYVQTTVSFFLLYLCNEGIYNVYCFMKHDPIEVIVQNSGEMLICHEITGMSCMQFRIF